MDPKLNVPYRDPRTGVVFFVLGFRRCVWQKLQSCGISCAGELQTFPDVSVERSMVNCYRRAGTGELTLEELKVENEND